MNKPIDRIVIDANLYADGYFDRDSPAWHQFYTDKLIELIVRECTSKLEEAYVAEEDIIEGYNEDWDNTLRYAVTTIKKHFGVEE